MFDEDQPRRQKRRSPKDKQEEVLYFTCPKCGSDAEATKRPKCSSCGTKMNETSP